MRAYVETFFRHRILLIVPLVIAIVAGVGYEVHLPKKFVSSGTLWADAPIPSESTIVSGGSTDGGPAAQQLSVLDELLHTKDFLAKVAQRGYPQAVSDSALAAMARSVSASTLGPQVLSVSVRNSNPTVAEGTAKAVMDEFMSEVVATRQARAQALADYYKQQADAAGKAIATAQTNLSQYVQAHPSSTSDATATQLAGSVGVAQQQYAQALDSYAKASLGLSHVSDASQLRIIDKPLLPSSPQGRTKKILFAGVGGLVAGSVISLMALMFLVATDTAARHKDDIEDVVGLQVVGTVKQFPARRRSMRKVS